jgi:hypothetical protein
MAEEKKFTYEELETITKQMAQQIDTMRNQLQQNSFNEAVARLNFSFQVLQNEKFFPKKYVESIVEDIQNILAIQEDEEEVKPKERKTKKVENQ